MFIVWLKPLCTKQTYKEIQIREHQLLSITHTSFAIYDIQQHNKLTMLLEQDSGHFQMVG